MIKGNESDIVFEILPKKDFNLLFNIVFSMDTLFITLSLDISKCIIFKLPESGVRISKLKILDM